MFTYLYVNTSEFENATDRLPQADAARVRALSKPSNDQDQEFEHILQVMECPWMTRYGPLVQSLVHHEAGCQGGVDRDRKWRF
jgi:hypothetical protein